MSSRKSVLITGGLGFIGIHLAKELLEQGHSVVLFDNLSSQVHGVLPRIDVAILESPDVRIVRGDITDAAALKQVLGGIEAIVHLAAETGTAQSMYEIARFNLVNSQGTAILMDVLANSQHSVRKVILASSRSIYGEGAYRCLSCGVVYPPSRSMEALLAHEWDLRCPGCGGAIQAIPTPETGRPNPSSIYAATKLAQEFLVAIACRALGIGSVILRLHSVYGEGQSLSNPYAGILSIFSTRIRRGLEVPIFEDGQESRDFIHAADVARAICLSLTSAKASGRVLNVGSGKPTTVLEAAEVLIDALGGSARTKITGQSRLGDIRHCYADLSLTSEILGFYPEISLQRGLERFARWVGTRPSHEDGLERANNELRRRKLMG